MHHLSKGVLTVLLITSVTTLAHEPDNWTLPADREFADWSDHLTKMAYDAIDRGAASLNARIDRAEPSSRESLYAPRTVASAVNGEFSNALFQIEGLDALSHSDAMRARHPGKIAGYMPLDGVRKYVEFNLNPLHAWRCATIRAFGVYLGTDKIGHMTDMGMNYYRVYSEARASGMTDGPARLKAVELGTTGPFSERGILGWVTAGAYSNADLVANYAGMLFYINLTEPVRLKGVLRPPMLERDGIHWRVASYVRPDSDFFAWFVSEHWDEALNPSLYLESVRPGIRRAIRENSESILDHHADANGNRQSREHFERKLTELSTYWGEEYGCFGSPTERVTIAQTCFPPMPDPDQPAARDAMGFTPLHHAAALGNVDLIRRLLDRGAEVNAQVRSNERSSSEWGNTPLHYAARDGHLNAVKLLIDRGAAVQARSDLGATPLHRAIGHASVAEALLAAGANVNARDVGGRTPLHWAAAEPNADVIALLLRHKADTQARDRLGHTPVQSADGWAVTVFRQMALQQR